MSRLHFAHHYFLQVAEHSLLLHTRRMLLCNSLSLKSQLIPLFCISLNFCLYVLLVASRIRKTFTAALDVQVLFVQSLHLQFDQLILKLIQLDFCVHCIHLVSQFGHYGIDFLDIVLNFCSDSQKWLFFGFVFIFNRFKLLKNLFFLFQLWSQHAFLFSNLL
jgi:hypothetical protein